MADTTKRNSLTPWYIGLAVIILAAIYVGYKLSSSTCDTPAMIDFIVVVIMPAIYLVLMFLTLRSQR